MSSALAAQTRNYTLEFQPEGALTLDAATGRYVPDPNVKALSLTVCGVKRSRNPELLRLVGADVSRTPLKMHLHKPDTLPSELVRDMTAPMKWSGIKGMFRFLSAPESPYPQVDEAMGRTLEGVFEV